MMKRHLPPYPTPSPLSHNACQVTKRSSTGLLAAAFTAIVPSYISRSVGGSYDNEGVAIFALVFVFYLWIKSVNTGSMMWACLTVSEGGGGGYSFHAWP